MPANVKQWLGLTIAIICGLISLVFVLLFGYHLANPTGTEADGANIIAALFSCLLFSFGFAYGLRLWRRGRIENQAKHPKHSNTDEIRFSSMVSLRDYRWLLLSFFFKSPLLLYFYLIVGMLAITQPSIVAGIFLILFPFGVVMASGSIYDKTPTLKEELIVTASVDMISLKGVSQSSELRWSSIVKVKELQKWFLLYTSPQVSIVLNKEKMDVGKFRSIVRSVPGLLCDLKSR